MEKIKNFFTKNPYGAQIYSFIKTYFVIFLSLYFYNIDEMKKEAFDVVMIVECLKYSFVGLLRNAYKLLTESKK